MVRTRCEQTDRQGGSYQSNQNIDVLIRVRLRSERDQDIYILIRIRLDSYIPQTLFAGGGL